MFRALSVRLGWRYSFGVARERLLSFLARVSSAGLALGVALLITVLSVMNGFQQELEQRILNLVPQATVGSYFGLTDWQSARAQAQEHPGVLAAAPYTKVQAMLSARNVVVPVLGFGIEPSLESTVSDIEQFIPDLKTVLSSPDAIVMGEGLALELKVSIGDHVLMIVPSRDKRQLPHLQKMTVTALFKTATEIDHQLALLSLDTANQLRGMVGAEGLRLKLVDLFEARSVAWQVQRQNGQFDFASDWSNTHGNLYRAVVMSRNIVSLLLMVIVLVAVFNVVSALVMGVRDKEGEIAILRTMGLSKGAIMRTFIVQGTIIGAVGISIGVLIGVGLSAMAPFIVASIEYMFGVQFLDPNIYPISYLPSDIRWSNVVTVASVSLIISMLATLIPAWRASSLEPAKALRGE